MALQVLSPDEFVFPHPFTCFEDGFLCVGGDLHPERLLLAYQFGIFPWYSEGDPLLWWTPYPRMVLYLDELKLSKSLMTTIRKEHFRVTFDRNFQYVIDQCSKVPRRGQDGTWITSEMKKAYYNLHKLGFAHSVEVWNSDKIVGGLYGIALGKIFYGESMFYHEPNASKVGFAALCDRLKQHDFELVDCQQETAYMASFGAKTIPAQHFIHELRVNALRNRNPGTWRNTSVSMEHK